MPTNACACAAPAPTPAPRPEPTKTSLLLRPGSNRAYCGEDLCVPVGRIPETLRAIQDISKKHDIPIATYGHIGGGGLHPGHLIDGRNPDDMDAMFLHDVPGFVVGSVVEKQGIIRHGAKMLFAVSEATVPKISVIVRKSYGAGYFVMNGRAYEADYLVAWPTAEIAVMGPDGVVNIAFRKQVEEAPEGPERDKLRIELAEKMKPDIILLDLMMPEMNGYELLNELRKLPELKGLPIIMVTARDDDSDVLHGYQHGADYYITKPYTADQLRYGLELYLTENQES